MKPKAQFEVYPERNMEDEPTGEWRFRLRHLKNKKILMDGGEAYATKSNAKRAISSLRGLFDAPIVVLD